MGWSIFFKASFSIKSNFNFSFKFPFDEQLCVIVFGSWSHSLSYLNYSLITEDPSLDSYSENNVWKLISYKPFRNEVKYDAWIENDPFSEVIYKILIRRKPLFVLQNCVIPAVMLVIY
jgi:nicotinic acetylcholine receptor